MVSTLATNTPTTTAVTKSQKIVSSSTSHIKAVARAESRGARRRKFQSMISIPTFTRIPASTAIGITEAKPPAPRVTTSNTSECTTPESGVRPPACTLVTVRIVAPAPGKPPNSAAPMFPRPWPISSRSELCWVRVMLSATSEVSSESIEPSTARVSA